VVVTRGLWLLIVSRSKMTRSILLQKRLIETTGASARLRRS
jgi:hypothetical protein